MNTDLTIIQRYHILIRSLNEIDPHTFYSIFFQFKLNQQPNYHPISQGCFIKQVAKTLLDKGYEPYKIEIFLKELAWRDYFQHVWVEPGSKTNDDVKQKIRKVFASFNGLKSFSNIRGGNINTIS